MKYTIGEFAELIGVTKDTLRVYEKHGIVAPLKDHKNNYRYFSDLDCRNILMSRWYRSFDISLKETSELNIESSSEQILERITENSRKLEIEIIKSKMLLEKMNELKTKITNIPQDLNICKKKTKPGIYRIKQTDGNILIQNNHISSIISQWMKHLPFVFYSFQIARNIFLTESFELTCNWGLAIQKEDFAFLDLKQNRSIEYIPPGKYLHSVLLISSEENFNRKSFQFIIDHINKNKYHVTGDIIGSILLTEKDADGNITSYLDINIPIK